MLNGDQKTRSTLRGKARKKWHDEIRNVPSMGCSLCPEYSTCGGLCVSKPLFWCMDYCCGNPSNCDVVCRSNPKFVDFIREIGGFEFDSIPRAAVLPSPSVPKNLPMIFHGNSREGCLPSKSVVLPLARMFDRLSGESKFHSRVELCEKFKIDRNAIIVLSGTDKDSPIEGWWQIGQDARKQVIRNLKELNIAIATSPNYSLFVDQPRWDDLHAMKKIAIVHGEMLREGLPAALHINGRTQVDFERWAKYIRARPEISSLAYEFATGTGWNGRREQHVNWLLWLARYVGRPLDLFVRGGADLLPALRPSFANVVFIDTASFMRTIKRRRAEISASGLKWKAAPTAVGQPLDELLRENVLTVETWIVGQLPKIRTQMIA